MVDFVFENVPNNPSPCLRRKECSFFFGEKGWWWEKGFEISGRPVGKGVSNQMPALLKPTDQLSRLADGLLIIVPGDQTGITFTQPSLEPKDA